THSSARYFSHPSFFLPIPATPPTYTLSLHDALPIFRLLFLAIIQTFFLISWFSLLLLQLLRHLFYRHLKLHRQRYIFGSAGMPRSEERFSRNAETDLVCRLLLEKKKRAQSCHPRPSRQFSLR